MIYDKLDRPLAHLFMHTGRILRERVISALGKEGLFLGQGRILEALLELGKMNQGEIGKLLDIKPATVTNQVKSMEAKGLIKRRKDPKDDRFMNVTLTPEGVEAAKYMISVMIQAEEEVRSALTEKEIDVLRKPLEKLRDKFRDLGPKK